jgi:hypothetical protein
MRIVERPEPQAWGPRRGLVGTAGRCPFDQPERGKTHSATLLSPSLIPIASSLTTFVKQAPRCANQDSSGMTWAASLSRPPLAFSPKATNRLRAKQEHQPCRNGRSPETLSPSYPVM